MTTLTLISVTILLGQADVPQADDTSPQSREISDKEIGTWIQALDADLYAERERATERLVAAGGRVIPAVLEAADEDNLEVATRVVFVLQQLALSSELETEISAHDALKQLAQDGNSSAHRSAKRSLEQLASFFQGRALDQLQRLGADVNLSVLATGGQQIETINSVEISNRWKGNLNDLKHLEWFTSLSELRLAGSQVQDDWLEVVSTMKNLGRLRLKHTSITDDGLSHIQQLAPIQLEIWYSELSDTCIENLAAFQGVRVIQLYGTQISPEGAERLAEMNKGLVVDYRPGGALLGVQCHNEVDKCTIVGVQPKSGAASAGLRKSDIIVMYDGEPVQNFDVLRKLIGKNSPGDRVPIKVLRGAETIDTKVVLGEWQW